MFRSNKFRPVKHFFLLQKAPGFFCLLLSTRFTFSASTHLILSCVIDIPPFSITLTSPSEHLIPYSTSTNPFDTKNCSENHYAVSTSTQKNHPWPPAQNPKGREPRGHPPHTNSGNIKRHPILTLAAHPHEQPVRHMHKTRVTFMSLTKRLSMRITCMPFARPSLTVS